MSDNSDFNSPIIAPFIILKILNCANIIIFLVIGLVSGSMTGEGVNIFTILMMIVLPLVLGAITGLIGEKVLKKECNKWQTILKVTELIILTVAIGVYINENILSIKLVLSGISFATIIANMVGEERLNEIMKDINLIIGIALVR